MTQPAPKIRVSKPKEPEAERKISIYRVAARWKIPAFYARHKLLMARPARTGFNLRDIDARFLPDRAQSSVSQGAGNLSEEADSGYTVSRFSPLRNRQNWSLDTLQNHHYDAVETWVFDPKNGQNREKGQ